MWPFTKKDKRKNIEYTPQIKRELHDLEEEIKRIPITALPAKLSSYERRVADLKSQNYNVGMSEYFAETYRNRLEKNKK